MTIEDKEHKIKLIMLIIICRMEAIRKSKYDSSLEMFKDRMDLACWSRELALVQSQPMPRFDKGGLAHINDDKEKKVILNRKGKIIN